MRKKNLVLKLLGLLLCTSCVITIKAQQCDPSKPPTQSIECLKEAFRNPDLYPGFVFISANKGYWKNYPENSLHAVGQAIHVGVEMVELDLMKSSDGEIFIMNDWYLDRLTNKTGQLRSGEVGEHYLMEWNDIKRVLLRDPKDPNKITSQTLPLLRDVLHTYENSKILLYLDNADVFLADLHFLLKEYPAWEGRIYWKASIEHFPDPSHIKDALNASNEEFKKFVESYIPVVSDDFYTNNTELALGYMLNYMSIEIEGEEATKVVGFEMLYETEESPMIVAPVGSYYNILHFLNSSGFRPILSTVYPESCEGVWNPSKFRYEFSESGTARGDHMIVGHSVTFVGLVNTDRPEIYLDYLQYQGKRE